jgi:branched-chain amino acid transport system ATP-binding protein
MTGPAGAGDAAGAVLLEVAGVDVHYGDFQALFGVDLVLRKGETLAVIGANGAGKSTLLGAVAGLHRVTRGEIRYDGRPLAGVPAHRRARLGIALVPEGRRLFPTLTVEENLLVGGYRSRAGSWDLAAVYELFPIVAQRRHHLGAMLSGGEQQAVAIGRGLMSNPRLLLLDEVSLGLAPVVVQALYGALGRVTAAGTTVLLVEQDVRQALAVADRVHYLLEGRTTLESPAPAVTQEELARAYFGLEAS